MKTTKVKELRELTNEELATKRRDLKSETVNLRVQQESGQLENPARLCQVRRELARIETIFSQRKQAAATARRVVKTYICPSDPSVPGDYLVTAPAVGLREPFAVGTYALNFPVFAYTGTPSPLATPADPPQLVDYDPGWGDYASGSEGRPRIPDTIPDGTSQTILFAEKYARCLPPGPPRRQERRLRPLAGEVGCERSTSPSSA